MPLVRIAMRDGKSPEYRSAVADAVHAAMVAAIGIPSDDRFQVVSSHGDDLFFDRGYLGIERTEDVVFIQVTLNIGRTLEQKKALYAEIARRLGDDPGVRPGDIVINLLEVPKENWSFGNGEAQYA